MAATRRGTGEIGRSLLDLSMAATGGEPEDREITLDLNHLWIHRGGPTQEVARVGGFSCWWRGSWEEKGYQHRFLKPESWNSWKGGAPPWPLSLTTETVCPMLKD